MSKKPVTPPERTGWRDERISRRHREWGFALPAVDLDFPLLEYQFGKPIALIEYKSYQARTVNLNSASFRAMTILADNSAIPFYVVRYWASTQQRSWVFRIAPVNTYAMMFVDSIRMMSELDFVTLLYTMRHQQLPDDIRRILGTTSTI